VEKSRRKSDHYFSSQPRSEQRLGVITTQLRGHVFEFLTSSSVFSKKRVDLGTRLLVESMSLPETGEVLDLGCGYGPVGIVAAKLHPSLQITMTDVNERAVWLARENSKRNHVKNTVPLHGFLYQPVEKQQFNTILSNPPVSAGKHVLTLIVQGAPSHLRDQGSFQIVIKSRIGGRWLLGELGKTFNHVEVLARESGYRVLLSEKS
jgi:16S rRNA (guanine1207-N2)-methyltransferase